MGTRYLEALEKFNITPNFWCSEEYFKWSGFEEDEAGGFLFMTDGEGLLFPAVHKEDGQLGIIGLEVWADFEGFSLENASKNFLDYEYIFDPQEFLSMVGGKWAVFRKNSRKFSRTKGNLYYERLENWDPIDLFLDWLKNKDGAIIQDPDVIEMYLNNGENRKFLHDGIKVYGVNIWDENYRYINFRYSFCEDNPFLSEYLRLLFYTDPEILEKKKLVNDGGSLDMESLRNFKMKMNPIKIREVYSWDMKEGL